MNADKPALFQRDFTMVVIGQIISLFGNAILRFALPLYLLRETGSSALFGAVTAVSFLPMVLLSLVGGVFADRMNKRNIMVTLDFAAAVLILSFYLMKGILPVIPLMIVCLIILYGISGAYQPAVQASIPVLVSGERILQGNAVVNMVSTLSGLLGPVIGGILFGTWGLTPILLISTACFACSAIMEIFIHIPYEKRQTETGALRIVRNDLSESWQFIRKEKPVFLPAMIVVALFNLVLSAAMIVGVPIMIISILKMDDLSLGITQGALGLGGLAGGCLGGLLGKKLKLKHSHWFLVYSSFAAGVMGFALMPFLPGGTGYLLITAMSFTAMIATTLFTIQMFTVVQQQTPPHLIGKIMALIISVAGCSQPVGQAIYGILFDRLHDISWVVLFGSAVLALIISLYSKRVFIRLEED